MKEKGKNGKINNPFTLPKNYFEEFHRNLMQQLPTQEIAPQSHIKSLLTTNKLRHWSYAAAATIIFLIGAAFYQYNHQKTIIAETENNEIIETIFDNYTIDDYNVYCYLTDSEIPY